MTETPTLSVQPLRRNLWNDFEELFGLNGACAGCWCMFWKLRGNAYEEARGYTARQMHKSIIDAGTATGLLAYLDGEVVGWVAVEPRGAYERLVHSRALKPVDEQEVWSITCFYVARKRRRKGISLGLLQATIEHVKSHGGKIVEGYPVETPKNMPSSSIHTGTVSTFKQAGFEEVARNTPTRPIFRFVIK